MRELLKEARDALKIISAYIENGEQLPPDNDPYWKASDALIRLSVIINHLDALAAPQDALEVVRKIRESTVHGHTMSAHYFNLTDAEATELIAALIAEAQGGEGK